MHNMKLPTSHSDRPAMSAVPVKTMSDCELLVLNRSYWPDAEATGQLLTELCESLAESIDVSVICGQPNQNPGCDAFRKWGTEIRNGVAVRRVPHTRFSKRARGRWRAVNMLTFMLSASITAILGRRPDVVVVETDPPLLCCLGPNSAPPWMSSRRLPAGYLSGCREGDASVAEMFPYRFVHRLFYRVYRNADHVIVLSHDMERHLVASGVAGEKISVVPNWVDARSVYPVKHANSFRREHGLNDRFVVMYSGNMGLSQNLERLLEAASLLRDRGDIVFALIGDGAKRQDLEREAAERGLRNVRFFDYQPKDQLAQSLSAADIHIVMLEPALVPFMMPSKIYGVLASGTPALVVTDRRCELAKLVESEDVGLVVEPGDVNRSPRRYVSVLTTLS